MIDIKKMRNDLRLNQRQFGEEINTTQATISAIESGIRKMSLDIYDAIVTRYGKEMADKYKLPEEGQTINIVQQKSTSSGSSTNYGIGNTVAVDSKILAIMEGQSKVLEEQTKQASKFQEQIDRLLSLLENK